MSLKARPFKRSEHMQLSPAELAAGRILDSFWRDQESTGFLLAKALLGRQLWFPSFMATDFLAH